MRTSKQRSVKLQDSLCDELLYNIGLALGYALSSPDGDMETVKQLQLIEGLYGPYADRFDRVNTLLNNISAIREDIHSNLI